MPCLVALIALFFPRIVLLLLGLFTDYLHRAFDTLLWPLLGFVFLPFTTLAYAFAVNQTGGHVRGVYLAIVVIAALVDLGVIGGGASRRRRK